ncbi:MAG: ASCH domain-containing protein [Anaerolineales bacterium]
MSNKADLYWAQFLRSRRRKDMQPAGSFSFGFSPADASQIAELVINGTKTATGSVLWSYEYDKEALPRRGEHWIVLDGKRDPVCIIRTTDVAIIAFEEVPECYAREGGEGDRTMKTWRAIYWKYILSECSRIGREPSKKAPLVMERFEVVYRKPLQAE